ncbi:unnamed protein product [Sphagnum troendelagicum]|uniref:Uncharacterized protein n=1 Tax=Sphagnum troendelagicum TaxID=128251 RepID=A0ABP0TY45_9BRYO
MISTPVRTRLRRVKSAASTWRRWEHETQQPPQPRLQRATPMLRKQSSSSSSRVATESNNAAAEGSTHHKQQQLLRQP